MERIKKIVCPVVVYMKRWLTVGLVGFCGIAQAAFVTIGNVGNSADTTGYGAVGYSYQISATEVTIAEWALFYNDANSGRIGSYNNAYNYWNDGTRTVGSNAPVVMINQNQAAQYCNWLTTGSALNGAYTVCLSCYPSGAITAIDRTFRNTQGMLYALPTENEWYKAAYNTGSDYSPYANGMGTAPIDVSFANNTGWNYNGGNTPDIGVWVAGGGALEQNGTYDMMGNVWELIEGGVRRGGNYNNDETRLQATYRNTDYIPGGQSANIGFRIVAIPEPATILLLGIGCMTAWLSRRNILKAKDRADT